jgi:hypothetical protein
LGSSGASAASPSKSTTAASTRPSLSASEPLRARMPTVRWRSAAASVFPGSSFSMRSSSSFRLSPGGAMMRPPSTVRRAHSRSALSFSGSAF